LGGGVMAWHPFGNCPYAVIPVVMLCSTGLRCIKFVSKYF